MCGITGFYGLDDNQLLKRMSEAIRHRGPDDHGYFVDRNVSLAHRRLSIIDLSKNGRNPMHNEDSSIEIVFNGEIYNFQSIKEELLKKRHKFYSNTDTEVIIHAYEEYGFECLKLFNGMFAFALWDANEQRLFIARDRLGIKPLYYAYIEGKFFFSSEIKSILQYDGYKKEIDRDSLYATFNLGYTVGEKTIFKGIHKLLPGHYACVDKNGLKIEKYWDLREDVQYTDLNDASKKLREMLEESVKLRLISDVPLGVYLSGGLDSSAITALVSKMQENVKTFSVGFGEGNPNELEHAKRVAEYLNTEHHEVEVTSKDIKYYPEIISYLDEPIGELALLPTLIISKYAKKHVTVVLAGEGADELFGGYLRHKMFLYGSLAKRFIPGFVRDRLLSYADKYPAYSNVHRALKIIGSKNNVSMFKEIVAISNDAEIKDMLNTKQASPDYTNDLIAEHFHNPEIKQIPSKNPNLLNTL